MSLGERGRVEGKRRDVRREQGESKKGRTPQKFTYLGGSLIVGTDVGRFDSHLLIIRKRPGGAGALHLGHLGGLVLHATGGVVEEEEGVNRGGHGSCGD